MKRYIKILFAFIRTCFLAEMEFRFSFSVFALTSVLWVFLNLTSITLLFGQVNSIAGWGKNEVLLLVCVRALFNSLLGIFMFPNLVAFNELIHKGELDFVLTKPINSRFWVTFRKFEFDNFLRVIVLVILISFFIRLAGHTPSVLDIGNFLFFVFIGQVVFYNFCLILMTTNFWSVDTFNLDYLFDSFQGVGQYPSTIFKGGIKLVLVFLLPTIFVSFFPTLALLGKTEPAMYLWAIIFLFVSSVVSQKFWNFALKRYSSASS